MEEVLVSDCEIRDGILVFRFDHDEEAFHNALGCLGIDVVFKKPEARTIAVKDRVVFVLDTHVDDEINLV